MDEIKDNTDEFLISNGEFMGYIKYIYFIDDMEEACMEAYFDGEKYFDTVKIKFQGSAIFYIEKSLSKSCK